ncbi:MAG: hypothetical protein UY23_C0001G0078 [Candidatus Jorgensenbacteria bacterium GW2011_GWA1_48_11]|uniref:Oligosaccharide repeat unit polymerase n=1 Tax=Candidatus Jorgensenbacteria bacterium GW2011_GWA1_48_11 TaxID=1618660 RepID=A0A0G1UBH8_9BACT|nr:MAG: hypothetical protein UY23_C0001G0078 [Candidatus Jorgensenbacteria bacterium GW2011_GWA1_48_11]KKW11965.1 MAG: hypothetical protein UY51_C0005G0207 [Candidatus Jorgensenbacteria bacterium GW2011_GWB1_49_9]
MAKSEKIALLFSKIKNIDFFALPWFTIAYYLFFPVALLAIILLGLPAKSTLAYQWVFSWRVVIYLLLGSVSLAAGYLFAARIFRGGRLEFIPSFLKREWSLKKGFWALIALSVGNLFVKAIWIWQEGFSHLGINPSFEQGPFYSAVGFFSLLGTVALAVAFLFYYRSLKEGFGNFRVWKWWAWSLFVLEFIYGFLRGSRLEALIPIFVYLIVRHYIVGFNYKRTIFVILLSLLVVMPSVHFYNSPKPNLNWYFNDGGQSSRVSNAVGFALDSGVARINQYSIFYHIFEKFHDFWYGQDLLEFFISLTPPKFIWHDKPSIAIDGNAVGRQLGFVSPDDFKSGVGVTMIGDWYLNFGLVGIIAGMFFIGIIYKFIYFYLIESTNHSPGGVMLYTLAWLQIIKGLEGWIASTYAGLVKLIILLVLIHFFLVRNKNAQNQ